MLTHSVRHIFRTARPTNFKLGIRMEDDDPHHPQAPMTSNGEMSRSQGHVISLSGVGPMAHKSKTNSRSITKIVRRVPHDKCYITHYFQDQKVKGQGHRPTLVCDRPTNADTQHVPYLPNGKS